MTHDDYRALDTDIAESLAREFYNERSIKRYKSQKERLDRLRLNNDAVKQKVTVSITRQFVETYIPMKRFHDGFRCFVNYLEYNFNTPTTAPGEYLTPDLEDLFKKFLKSYKSSINRESTLSTCYEFITAFCKGVPNVAREEKKER